MGQWPPADDDALLRELGTALREAGPPPEEEFLAAGFAALRWRTLDVELAIAELTFDSACDLEPAGLTRSAGSDRALAFHAGPVAVAIEVTGSGIVGQLSPARGGRVVARTPHGPYEEVSVDPVGFFSLGPPPDGPVQLHARTSDYSVATSWVSLR
ncbi:hypothetical protein [Plantactinospora sp. WMMB782]|uniref:hypothetical protein n=1 Tax=Plantactinospora sp. WMMB782 TaxID=3404121 RepID=UPI003B93EEBF